MFQGLPDMDEVVFDPGGWHPEMHEMFQRRSHLGYCVSAGAFSGEAALDFVDERGQ
jgi:hypothetical protein